MLVRFGFICRGFEGLLPLLSIVAAAVSFAVPMSSLPREFERRGDAFFSCACSLSLVYWFLPTRPFFVAAFFLCDAEATGTAVEDNLDAI